MPAPSRKRRRPASPLKTWDCFRADAENWLLRVLATDALLAQDSCRQRWHLARSRSTHRLYYWCEGKAGSTFHKHSLLLVTPSKAETLRDARSPSPPLCPLHRGPRAVEDDPPLELGRGSFCRVRLATAAGRPVARKTPLISGEDRSGLTALRRDAHFLCLLAPHWGVLPLLGFDGYSVLMPLASSTLEEEPPRAEAAFAQLANALSDALRHVHATGVVHLDLKPANVLLLPSGRTCIADFGSATYAGSALDVGKLYESTRPFRAPELSLGAQQALPAMDLWSLGALLWSVYPLEPSFPLLGAQNAAEQLARALALGGAPLPEELQALGLSADEAAACVAAGGRFEGYRRSICSPALLQLLQDHLLVLSPRERRPLPPQQLCHS